MTTFYSIKKAFGAGTIAKFDDPDSDGTIATRPDGTIEAVGVDCFLTSGRAFAAFEKARDERVRALRKQLRQLENLQPKLFD